MSDKASAATAAAPAAAAAAPAATSEARKEEVGADGASPADAQPAVKQPSADAPAEKPAGDPVKGEPDHSTHVTTDNVESAESAAQAHLEPIDTFSAQAASKPADPMADQAGADASATVATPKRRKSVAGASASTGKKLNKKASKPNLLHVNAQPGDHFFVKLKGHPKWPVVICDDDMLPRSLLQSRPVTAKRADGTYRDDFADGGKRVHQRTFPVMYLYTNEFGWVSNADLCELDPEDCTAEKAEKLKRKDLAHAYELASQSHPLSYYKELLAEYQAEMLEVEEAKAAALVAEQTEKSEVDGDGDIDMDEVPDDEEEEPKPKKTKTNKRKAEDSAETLARSDSAKKPKIKITTTPKTTNGTSATPKAKSTGEAKSAKSKSKKVKETEKKELDKEESQKEPELSLEEKLHRKEKEVLFLRHRLQKGLITRDSEPKEEEMKGMAEYITKLETWPDLEASIIRTTKIHKVLKAILKLERIPKEEEFNFKSRSQVLWDKWNKILAADGANPAGGAGDAAANGVNGEKAAATDKGGGEKADAAEEKASSADEKAEKAEKADVEKTNGVKEHKDQGDTAAVAEKDGAADGEPAAEKAQAEITASEAVDA